jgi:hypothetical protein
MTVDHVGYADVVPRATAEVAAQSGHDVHMFIGLASAFEEHVVDLKDVSATLEKKYGKPVELSHRSTYNAFTKKQFALSDMWVPDPGNFHKKVWTDIGMPSGPSTYVHGAVLHVAADGLPQDVAKELAMVDGCSRLGAVGRVVLPLAVPGLLTVVIFALTLTIQEFVYSLTFISSVGRMTVSVGVPVALVRGDVYYWGSLMAACLITSVPLAILYNFFLDRFIAGFTVGAIK